MGETREMNYKFLCYIESLGDSGTFARNLQFSQDSLGIYDVCKCFFYFFNRYFVARYCVDSTNYKPIRPVCYQDRTREAQEDNGDQIRRI